MKFKNTCIPFIHTIRFLQCNYLPVVNNTFFNDFMKDLQNNISFNYLTIINVSTALKHQSQPQDHFSGQCRVNTADTTPTQDFVDNIEDVNPL